jgi:hypothetical protein
MDLTELGLHAGKGRRLYELLSLPDSVNQDSCPENIMGHGRARLPCPAMLAPTREQSALG